ncbi:tetratricopeptide repeat protein [Candidatus Dependentiae bacterium]|nr:tetratricopeptide repeat protein [Candidatus Dependentiae bacterium]
MQLFWQEIQLFTRRIFMEFAKNPLIERLQKIYKYGLSHKKEVALAALVVVGIIFCAIGYSFYRVKIQQRAQLAFVEASEYFNARVIPADSKEEVLDFNEKVFKTEKDKWVSVAKVFEDAYLQNKSATIAPMFLAYQAEALIRLSDLSKAIKVLKEAIKLMPDSEFKSFYQVKNALIMIDLENNGAQQEGLSILKKFALDQKSSVHDMVLYRLGEYYWNTKNFDEAKNYWNQLILIYGKSSEKPSWWAEQAKPKLKLITSK